MKLTIGKQLILAILFITLSSIQQRTTLLSFGNTTIWWLLYTFSIFVMIKALRNAKIFANPERKALMFIQLLLLWYLICIIRGCFIAVNYWQWKNLVGTSFTMMLPLVAYLAINPAFVSFITQKWLRWVFPLFFLFLPFFFAEGAALYLVPISIFLLFFSVITHKWKIIFLCLLPLILLGDIGARSTFIKYGVPLAMSLGIYARVYKLKKITRLLYYLLLLLPIVLFGLGVSGVFNIFKLDEFLGEKVVVQNGEKVSLTADTRTWLYGEVLLSAIKHDYYIWGHTPAKGNESVLFGDNIAKVTGTKANERFSNEASILNIFTWTGVVGVILYFLVFAKGAYLAVFKSRNQFARLLGLYVLFRWCYAWVEDFTNFDLSYFYLWIVIGLCYSRQFRAMSDLQVKYWVRGIFDVKYRRLANEYDLFMDDKVDNMLHNGVSYTITGKK